MNETKQDPDAALNALREERLRLERESLEVERVRLAAVKTRAEGEARLGHGQPSVMLATALLFALACFLVGVLIGAGGVEYRAQRARDQRLAVALSQLSGGFVEPIVATNSPSSLPPEILMRQPQGAHRNVSVVVIE